MTYISSTPREGHGTADSATARMRLSTDRPDADGAAELLLQLYADLHSVARQWFAGQPADHTLQPTALINEAFLRISASSSTWRTRTHFYGLTVRAMRQILVDHSRRRAAVKRGRAWQRAELGESEPLVEHRAFDVLDLLDALDALARLDPRQHRIVELRFLAGLSIDDTAAALDVSARTVKVEWRMARAWLLARLQECPT